MLTPKEFDKEYPDEKLEEELLDRQLASIRDIQYIYGKLYTLATLGDDEYAPYLTPNDATSLLNDENSLIVIRADLSGDTPSIDEEQPVEIRPYKESLIEEVSLCAYSNKGSGVEHSITHKTGGDKDWEDMVGYAEDRLQRWPTENSVKPLIDDHQDGWIINDLIKLGENEQAINLIRDYLKENFTDERRCLVTVRVKTEPNGKYQWPGEIEVLKEGMKRHYESKLVSKGDATDSQGVASDMVTGEMTTTVGTATVPLNHYLGKQLEKFDNFDADEAWRTHSISSKTAIFIGHSKTFIESCSHQEFNGIIYYLPYITGEISGSEAKTLYKILYKTVEEDDLTPIENAYKSIKKSDKDIVETGLRFFLILMNKTEPSIYDIYKQEMEANLYYPSEIKSNHKQILNSWVYGVGEENNTKITRALPTHESWNLLNPRNLMEEITNGRYFIFSMLGDVTRVTASENTNGNNNSSDNPIPNDDRVEAYLNTLTGEKIAVERLLKNYVSKLIDNNGDDFPSMHVSGQFAQLSALAETGLLRANKEHNESITEPPTYTNTNPMSSTTQTDEEQEEETNNENDLTNKQIRKQKLDQFIEDTPALKNTDRLSSFLVGVMVGQVGSYQVIAEDLSNTVIDQYPISTVTKTKIPEIVSKALDRNQIYSRKEDLVSPMYGEVVEYITETVGREDPTEWDISVAQVRMYYSLGVSYGQQNWTTGDNNDE